MVYSQLIAATFVGYLVSGDWPDFLAFAGLLIIVVRADIALAGRPWAIENGNRHHHDGVLDLHPEGTQKRKRECNAIEKTGFWNWITYGTRWCVRQMIDYADILTVSAVFILAGIVKGVIGLGLPTVSLALLTVTSDLITAMSLMLVPSFATNVRQAFAGGGGREILRRAWPFFVMATVTIGLGAVALVWVKLTYLSLLLGLLLIIQGVVGLMGARFTISARMERPAGAAFGALNGLLTGMTGSFVFPGVLYLQAIGLPRDALIQAMGILFLLSTVALAFALGGGKFLNADLGLMSVLAVVPAFAGMLIGERIRAGLSEATFRYIFFASLIALGGYIIIRHLS